MHHTYTLTHNRCTNEDIENIVTKNLVDPDKSSESKVGAAALPGGDDVGHTEKKKAPTVRFAAPLHTHTRDDSPEARASKLEQLQQQQLERENGIFPNTVMNFVICSVSMELTVMKEGHFEKNICGCGSNIMCKAARWELCRCYPE